MIYIDETDFYLFLSGYREAMLSYGECDWLLQDGVVTSL